MIGAKMEDEDKQTIRVIKGKIHQPLYTNEREYERRGKYFEDNVKLFDRKREEPKT